MDSVANPVPVRIGIVKKMKTHFRVFVAVLLLWSGREGFSQQVETLASRTNNNCWAIALDATHVYWTEPGAGIRKVQKSGGDVVTLTTIANGALVIAVFRDYVYWAESRGYGTIRMMPKAGGDVTTVYSNLNMGSHSGIRGLAVDSSGIYWVQNASTSYLNNSGAIWKMGGVPVDDPAALATNSPVILAGSRSFPMHLV
jgi:hypothetical protein